jgi:endo-1,4-beta-xylanase
MVRRLHRLWKRPVTAALKRRWGLLTVAASLLLACSQGGESQGTGPGDTPTPTALPCIASGSCTLREAAAAAVLWVGVAAAPRDEGWNRLVLKEFNALSPEGELVWRVIHPGPEEWDFEGADQTLAFADEHGLFTTVSHFVWDQATSISGTPGWVKAIQDPDELRQVMRDHLATITVRYGGKIDRWIVVNEPLDYGGTALYQNHFYNVLGPDYISQTFRIAEEAAPDSELWLNEILTENNPAKASALVDLAASLVAAGVPIDGVGLQGHLFAGEPDYALVQGTMQRLADLGLKVAITELDAPVGGDLPDRLEVQAQRMAGMVRACLAVSACDSVTFWGLSDDVSWLNSFLGPNLDPLLFDASLQPKPAYFAVRGALLAGRTDVATP